MKQDRLKEKKRYNELSFDSLAAKKKKVCRLFALSSLLNKTKAKERLLDN
jgi:hypothetical protein